MKPPYGAMLLSSILAAGCAGGGTPSASMSSPAPLATQPGSVSQCSGKTQTSATSGPAPVVPAGLTVAGGLHIETVAHIGGARELAALPNGDVLVGTGSSTIYLLPNAESSVSAGTPIAFASMPESGAAGVAFDRGSCTIVVGTTYGVYAIPYTDGDISARTMRKIASVRTGGGGGHSTTSVAVSNGTIYASVGSSCNACTETDPTRATIQQMHFDGSGMSARAVHIRNAIALAVNPQNGDLWAGDAGQDALPPGHPYEFFDNVSARPGGADYGWPRCEENHQSYGSGAACANTVVPLVELPAYSTIVGAAFYPSNPSGPYAMPSLYRGGAFLAAHGSWHQSNGRYDAAPQVVFVPMNGNGPATPVNWSDPTRQWSVFVGGFQLSDGKTRLGRPTGIAVGAQGSVFIADDETGAIYRVRPAVAAAAASRAQVEALASASPMPKVVTGFSIARIGTVFEARELAIGPSGDLFVGTRRNIVEIVPHAEAAQPSAAQTFVQINDAPDAGVALANDALFVGTQFGVYRIAYSPGQLQAASAPERIARVRISGASRDHETTSVAWTGDTLYASIGSSCNACKPELDASRATIMRVDIQHHRISPVAIRMRNPIALAINPISHALWAGVAGVDDLPPGQPYEIFDDVTAHPAPADYGWPSCYDNQRMSPRWPGDCSHTAIPRVVFPAYQTPIGAVFYPASVSGTYAFPKRYRGGVFVTLHGSWHGPPEIPGFLPPRVVFVAMIGDQPYRPVDWNNPYFQWSDFINSYQVGGTLARIGRPTGIAVGPQGSLFVADDRTGAIYRIRPASVGPNRQFPNN